MINRMAETETSPLQVSGQGLKPRVTMRGVGIVLVSWVIYTLLVAITPNQTSHGSYFTSLLWQAIGNVGKFAFSVPVWFIVIRWMHEKSWYWKGLAHLFLGPAYVGLDFWYQYCAAVWFGNGAFAQQLKANPGWLLFFDLFIYILQFSLYHSYDILTELRIKEKTNLELITLQKERELAILKSQINPCFLFNTLDSISAMASRDPEETRKMIAQLGDLLRYVIEAARNDRVPLQKELRFVKDYVDLESRRGGRLKIEFLVDRSVVKFPVPPMILQPLVENAIIHGIEPFKSRRKITVQIRRNGNSIAFRVSDARADLLSGDPLSIGNDTGLRNTDARLRGVYGDSAGLKISSLEDSGSEVSFVLPST